MPSTARTTRTTTGQRCSLASDLSPACTCSTLRAGLACTPASEAKLETDVWRTTGGEQRVKFWREPLSAFCAAATRAGFLIEQVIEPLPAPSMRDRFPGDYEKLTKEPGFLILRLIKPPS